MDEKLLKTFFKLYKECFQKSPPEKVPDRLLNAPKTSSIVRKKRFYLRPVVIAASVALLVAVLITGTPKRKTENLGTFLAYPEMVKKEAIPLEDTWVAYPEISILESF